MPFGIGDLAKLAFDPPSFYIVPLAFVVALPSYVSTIPYFFVAIRAVFSAPPSAVVALPSK